MNLLQWKKEFLSKNNRGNLIGSPLYAYKMSEQEFIDLKKNLRENIATYLNIWDINDVLSKSSAIPELFVLYAAIWWQREYDGTGMTWEPIFSSIGIDVETVNSPVRSAMIESGLRYWRIELNHDIGNLKFIGNIASQGGLPLKLIAAGHGILNSLLKRVLKDVVNLAFQDHASILSIIESHKSILQKSYRQPLIYNLLSEIIITFMHLKDEANLSGSSNPLEKLDQYKSNWRDSFPLPMDDENARGVLERFIQEGVRIKAEKPAFSLSLNRFIQIENDKFRITSRLDLPRNNIDGESVKKVFNIDDSFITRTMRLHLTNQIESHEVVIGKLAGQDNYRFNFDHIPLFKKAEQEHLATLQNTENTRREVYLTGGFELDDETPWVFEADGDGDDGKFLKVGAGKFKSSELYVVVPSTFDVNSDQKPIAYSDNNDKKCYLVNEVLRFTSADGEQYLISPSCHDADDEEVNLNGIRIWDVFQKPAVAFKGYPQVVKYISTTPLHKKQVPTNAICKNLNNKPLSQTLGTYGPLNLSVRENNSNVWAAKIVALPVNANFKMNPGVDANQGSILLNNWGVSNVRCISEDINLTSHKNNEVVTLECIYTGATTPNEFINLELFWPNNPNTAIVKLPFPSSGVIAFDADGHRIEKHKTLSLRQMYGVKVVSILNQSNFVEIDLSLRDTGNIKIETNTIRLKRDRDSSKIEIRLIDFKEQISDLLYAVDHLDSKVEFRVKVAGAKDFVLFINKYDIEFDHKNGSTTFMIKQSQFVNYTNEMIKSCEVMATRIDQDDDVLQLEQLENENTSTGIWKFPDHKYPNGCWIIHPSAKSSIQFRSMILPLGQETQGQTDDQSIDLKNAMAILDEREREVAINLVLEELIINFNHPDWLHIEYLAQHLGHLNLTSLHLWRLFAKNKRSMAALVLRDSKLPEHFINRFATELPFMWELVNVEAWLDAAYYLKKQIFQNFKDESFSQKYFEYLLQNKLNGLLVEYPSLNMVFEIVKHKNQLPVNQEMQGVINHPLIFGGVFTSQIFEGEDSDLQKLLRTDTQEWPSTFFNEITGFKQSEHKDLMCLKDFSFKDPVINFPFVVAINSLTQELPPWLVDESAFLKLKRLKKFDEDWFDSAFDKTIARAITMGYVQL